MNVHEPGRHLPSCSSPDNCAEFRGLMSMDSTQYSAWLKKQDGIRTAARRGELRALDTSPPDPYCEGLKALRAANLRTPNSDFVGMSYADVMKLRTAEVVEDIEGFGAYAAGVKQMREEQR